MKRLLTVGLVVMFSVGATFADIINSQQSRVGPYVASDGSYTPSRTSRDGTTVVQDGHADYQEPVYRGNVWSCANPAGTSVTTQAGLSYTTPMLTLYNPTGSGKYLVLWEVQVTPTAAPAAAAGIMLAYNVATGTAPVHTSAANYINMNMGVSGTPTAICDRVSTLIASPVAFRYIGGTTGAAAISGIQFTDNVDGRVIIPPGMAISIQTTSAVVGVGHFVWEEISYP